MQRNTDSEFFVAQNFHHVQGILLSILNQKYFSISVFTFAGYVSSIAQSLLSHPFGVGFTLIGDLMPVRMGACMIITQRLGLLDTRSPV